MIGSHADCLPHIVASSDIPLRSSESHLSALFEFATHDFESGARGKPELVFHIIDLHPD